MRKDQLVVLVLFVLVVGAAIALQTFGNSGADGVEHRPGPSDRIAPAPSEVGGVGQLRGFCLQMQHPDNPYEQYIEGIAGTGANTICLTVAAYQENCSSTSLFVEARRTPTDAQLKTLIAHAHRRGLRVVLMPIVLLENARKGEWRGKIAPDRWDDWWEDYNTYILHYGRIAAAAGVEVLLVGSELVSTEAQEQRWRDLIAQVRRIYRGRLSYSANWDHYRPIKWWDALDIVGMTTYYDLTGGDEPTLERLMESWRPIKEDILRWQAGLNRPILFTEVGWPNQVNCAQYPWNYFNSSDKPDQQAQANCFEAFFRTWEDTPSVAGFLVWEWRNHPSQPISETDTSYVPLGKPKTMAVIRKYISAPNGGGR